MVKQNFALMQTTSICLVLHTTEGIRRKYGPPKKIELESIEFKRHPNNIEALLEIDTNAEPFYFQKSWNVHAINNET